MVNRECSVSKKGILFNLEEGLKCEERALAIYEDLAALLDKRIDYADDLKVIREIIADEKRHIKIVNNLKTIVDDYYID